MGLAPVLVAALVGLALAAVNALVSGRVSNVEEGERLDRDSVYARLAWLGDVVVLAGLSVSTLGSAVIKWRADDGLSFVTALTVVVSLSAAALVAVLVTHHKSAFINRYPDSLYDDVWRGWVKSPSKWVWLTPGAIVAIAFGVILAASAVVAAYSRVDADSEDPPEAPEATVPVPVDSDS